MKSDLIFLTTATTRGELHNQTIGLFYKTFESQLKLFNLTHIVNIDLPIKLRGKFTINETHQLLNKIIPDYVRKIFIIKKDENPSFTKAYKNVIRALYDNNLYKDNCFIWWLEDDWKLIGRFNFIPLLKLLQDSKPFAMSLTDNAPLCSFRGGPIMNASFFNTFFDVSNCSGDKFDPEQKVYRNISLNRTIPIYTENIYIICIHLLNLTQFPYSMKECSYWHYSKKFNNTKFGQNKGINYILACMVNTESKEIYYKSSVEPQKLTVKDKNELSSMKKVSIDDFKKLIDCSSLNYINIVPQIQIDIGREFNKQNGLIRPGLINK